MNDIDSVKVKYLDTSSIVKLYLDENSSNNFREYFGSDCNYCTTLMTFHESLNVLKARLFNGSSRDKYYKSIENLIIKGWGGKIEIENIDITDREIYSEVVKISVKYNLDIADAIQLYAIIYGKYKRFCFGSSSILITADNKQKQAAEDLKIRVWNIENQSKPNWV